MSTEQLEQRVAVLEQLVADLQRKVAATGTTKPWWEGVGRTMSQAEREAFDRATEYGRYFRKTGREAPSEWQPGDPIPEPDESRP
ncbi:MAG TPA: hypothetical protein VM529_02825 [Gemmata sp.]|nr:hypothetical protein [Gemmata sp.]